MKSPRLIALSLSVFLGLAAASIAAGPEVPTVNLPPNLREVNFEGNCVHASFVNLLRWQGHYELADWWVGSYHGGETASSFQQKLEATGIRYAMTAGVQDIGFLEKALATRRGCVVVVQDGPLYGYPGRISHAVCLVHIGKNNVVILDNNFGNRMIYVEKGAFLRDWRGFHSWAVTPLMGPPAPPQLWRDKE